MTLKILLEHHGETFTVALLAKDRSSSRPYLVRTYRHTDNAATHTEYLLTARNAATDWLDTIIDEEHKESKLT